MRYTVTKKSPAAEPRIKKYIETGMPKFLVYVRAPKTQTRRGNNKQDGAPESDA
jgi:hypothetical protein